MAFNVDQFSANLNRFGTLQTNKFEVIINDTNSLALSREIQQASSLFERLKDNVRFSETSILAFNNGITILRNRIDSVRLPAVTLDTFETRRYGVGPNIRSATNARFEPFSVSVLVDQSYSTYKFFQMWMETVFGTFEPDLERRGTSAFPLNLTSYKRNYATTIDVKVFDNNGSESSKYTFRDAFPIGITNPAMSWRDNNNLFRFDVTFAYTTWFINVNRSELTQ